MWDSQSVADLGQQLRVDSIRSTSRAGSGHATSSLSAADLMAVLMARRLRYDFSDPHRSNNDRLIFSKGHASPLLYAMFKAAGAITDDELLTYRRRESRLQGHPTPVLPWIDVATGALGQGLPIGVGIALAGKYLEKQDFRVWVLCGDSEMSEGSMWEACEQAAHTELNNLTAIIDVNRLGQRGETMHGWDTAAYRRRLEAFGWDAVEIDGHNVDEIDAAYRTAMAATAKPTAVIALTVKGRGVAAVENKNGFHGKALDDPDSAIAELGGERRIRVQVPAPEQPGRPPSLKASPPELPAWDVGSEVSTRKAYGEALASLGAARDDVVALDAEVSNSTYAEAFADAHPERYFEMFIAEQQMVAAAVGMQTRRWKPFASTFAAFLTRAHDFIRMAAVSGADIKLCGSHAGVSIGEDGPSQMGLEDIAMMRSVHGSTVLYPCDANQAAKLVEGMVDRTGIAYLRTTRPNTPVIYDPQEPFEVGGSKVLRSSDQDDVTIVAAGVTVHEALDAWQQLKDAGVSARVIDLYSIKPIDRVTLAAAADDTGGFVTVEDHHPEGGLGEAVMAALAESRVSPRVKVLAVTNMPDSGPGPELMAAAGIDAASIVQAAKAIVSQTHKAPTAGAAARRL